MAGSQPYSSSADLYPPIRHHPYDSVVYPDPSANPSVDYLDASSSHNNLNQLGGASHPSSPYMTPSPSGGPYGEKYSDGVDGPPEAMLASHAGGARGGRGYRDASSAGKQSFFQRYKKWIITAIVLLLAIIIAAVIGGVVASRNSSNSSSSNKGASGIGSNSNTPGVGSGSNSKDAIENSALTGGNGSTITQENGQTFTYINNFGGNWVSTPFDDSARPQSWSPRLNETWDYTNMKIYGVNLGGWLVTEPFIVPGLYEPYENDTTQAIDEYTLCEKYGDNATARMKEHYDTFITEEDFALIAGAGLSWIRLPFGFWAIETIEGEPFVEGLSWQYVLKAFTWARKYGLRINLDMHSLPGSQNGWNHSGKLGTVGFLNGTMGIANAQRSLNYIRTVTEFISQPEYRNLVPMFSFINEPAVDTIGNETMREFYLEAYNIIREITGTGEGNGAWVGFHDGFQGLPTWAGFMSGADRVSMDQHNYLGFSTPSNDSIGYQATKPCAYWASNYNNSMQNFGLSYSGEWSQAVNDCGVYLNNVGNGARFDGTYIAPGSTTPTFEAVGDCSSWNDWTTWDGARKEGLQSVAYAHMDATQNWFFWTWKIGTSIKTGIPPNPMWHMRLALQEGWFPTDPRNHVGQCNQILAQQGVAALPTTAIFTAYPSPWMTGGAGAGTIAADQVSSYSQWPPTSIREPIGTQATLLPTYVATGTPITLTASTPTAYPSGASTYRQGNGWADASDTAQWYVTKSGCSYDAPYDGVYAAVPTAAC